MLHFLRLKTTCRAFADASFSTTASVSIDSNKSDSIDKMAKFDNRSWHIVVRKYVLIIFSFEKLLSADANATGSVENTCNTVTKFG